MQTQRSYVTVLCLLLLISYCFAVVLVVVAAVLLVLTTKMLIYGPNANLRGVYFTSVLQNCGRPFFGHLLCYRHDIRMLLKG